ncbi:MAG: HNH endonuclease signature motif containing protein [Methanomassiliicoccales archaeon]|jgi:5-methylcytosine-specific restriction endonuclease McrA
MNKKEIRSLFSQKVLERDGHICVICGSEEDLTVHHITDRKEMPGGGYVPENGISICPVCHLKAEKFHQTGGKEWEDGMHPDDLYAKINSSYDLAVRQSEKLLVILG